MALGYDEDTTGVFLQHTSTPMQHTFTLVQLTPWSIEAALCGDYTEIIQKEVRMKIRVESVATIEETELVIYCQEENEDIRGLVHHLMERERLQGKGITEIKEGQKKLIGIKDGKHYLIAPVDVYYFESVENKVFIYLKTSVYESKLRLYELEELLEDVGFVRVTKSTILNLAKIKSFSAVFYGKFEVTMENGERTMISRQYVPQVKKRLGL